MANNMKPMNETGGIEVIAETESGSERVTFRLPKQQLELLTSLVNSKKFPTLSDAVRYAIADFVAQGETKPGYIRLDVILPKNDYKELEKMFGKDKVVEALPGIIDIYTNEIYPAQKEKFKRAMEYLKSKNT